jgi:hypothetical protein
MWRVGRKLGRTLYRDDVVVGMVDTPEIAAAIIEAMNAAAAFAHEPARKAVCGTCGGTTAVSTGSIVCGQAWITCPDCAPR